MTRLPNDGRQRLDVTYDESSFSCCLTPLLSSEQPFREHFWHVGASRSLHPA